MCFPRTPKSVFNEEAPFWDSCGSFWGLFSLKTDFSLRSYPMSNTMSTITNECTFCENPFQTSNVEDLFCGPECDEYAHRMDAKYPHMACGVCDMQLSVVAGTLHYCGEKGECQSWMCWECLENGARCEICLKEEWDNKDESDQEEEVCDRCRSTEIVKHGGDRKPYCAQHA